MATTRADLEIRINAKDQATSVFRSLGSSLATLGKVGAAAIGVATGAAVIFGKSSVKSFSEGQETAQRLTSIMLNLKGATMADVEAMKAQATQLQKVGVVSDDVVMAAQAQLATFDLQGSSIQKIIPGLVDMIVAEKGVAATSEDATNAARGLGKAFQGNFEMLTKQGFVISDAQKNMIEFGNENQKAKAIMEILGTTYKNVNQDMRNNTWAGAIAGLANTFDDFKEIVGGMIVDYLIPFVSKMNEIAQNLPAMLETAKARAVGAYSAIRDAANAFFSETNTTWVFIRDFFLPLWEQVRDTLVEAWHTIVEAIQPIKPELEMIAKFFGVIIIGAIMALITVIAKIIQIVAKVVTGIIQMFSGAVQILRGLFEGFFSMMLGDNDNAIKSFKKAWDGVKTFLDGIWKLITAAFTASFKPITDAINKLKDQWSSLKEKLSGGDGGDKRATGGSVMGNKAYMVGENGPEMFIPSGGGKIEKGGFTNGSGETVFNFDFTNANIVDRDMFIRQIKSAISREQELRQIGAT